MLTLALLATLLACVAAIPLGRVLGRGAGLPLALPLLIGAGLLVTAYDGVDEPVDEVWSWMPTLGVDLALRLDGLALVFALLVLVIGGAILVYASRYLGRGTQSRFYLLMTLFAAAMTLLVLSDDLVVMFVAWEITTLCSFFLISRSGPHAHEPAVRTLLVTVAGGLSLLAAVTTMIATTGTSRLSEVLRDPVWTQDGTFTTTVAVLLAVAAFTKSAQFPFQAWLPDSMVAITPVSAYLHAAAMVKAGIYLLLRFSPVLSGVPIWSWLLIFSGLVTALIGAAGAMRRHDLKELLAYSTISQLGLLVAAIGVGTEAALTAAVVHTIAHALFKATLFMLVGVIDHEAGTRDLRELARMRIRMPVTTGATALAAASMAGVPLLLGFVSKESLLDAFLGAPGPGWVPVVITLAAAATSVLTFAYSARFVLGAAGRGTGRPEIDHPSTTRPTTTSPTRPTTTDPSSAPAASLRSSPTEVHDGDPVFLAPPVLGALATLVLGLAPFLLDTLASAGASGSTGAGLDVHLALWHGLTPALGVSAGIISLGVVLVLTRARVDRLLEPLAFPFSGLDVVDALRRGTISFGGSIGRLTSPMSPRRHLAIPAASLALIAGWMLLRTDELPAQVGDPTRPLDWVLVALVAAGVVAAVRARSRISAVVVTGLAGFTISLWFVVLGAADVALTQLLVEILTVCVMVLLLRRLPENFRRSPLRKRVPAAVVAAAAGLATFAGVFVLTGRREPSSASTYYLTEGESITGGANIVNTILVDFRALDTLGELTVLGVAGLVVAVVVRSRRLTPSRPSPIDPRSPIADPRENTVFVRTVARVVGPLAVILSAVLLLRGHHEPGGGFIAALVGGSGFALLYLAAPADSKAPIRWPYLLLTGLGIMVGAGSGLAGYLDGSFLAPLSTDILGYHLMSSLVFDIGVYLAVLGLVLASFNLLGRPTTQTGPGTPTAQTGPTDAAPRREHAIPTDTEEAR
ncbi:DUF4040 family protein [Georgenia sp. Z1344]|uniref:DUF4040 family protein n=1 Tax=Georgenia sp. Z1344 TaxID=3416706 RepID=UPI003CF08EAB